MKRNNMVSKMNATLLVPGDRIILAAGAAVPADCTLCEGKPLQVDQAALTGAARARPAPRAPWATHLTAAAPQASRCL